MAAFGSLMRISRRGGHGQAVADAHLEHVVPDLRVELAAVDEDREARDVLCCLCRHQPSSFGRLSAVPRRRWSGFAISFASAIARQTVGSP